MNNCKESTLVDLRDKAASTRKEHSSPSDMGNAESSHITLTLTINETGPHTAGSTITGTIYATIDEHAKKGINDLTLYLIGKEDVGVQKHASSSSSGDGGSSASTSHEKCDIVRMMIPIPDTRSPTGMQRGQHEFPFQVGLPATLPSSMMSIQEDGGGYARIHYKIKAEATRYGKGKAIAKEEVPLVIIAKPPSYHVPTPTCIEPTSSDVRLFYFLPRGNISFTANVSDTSVGIGEAVEIGLGCKNESKTSIKFVRAYVMQKVSWCANSHHAEEKTDLVQGEFSLDDDTKTPRRGQIVGLPVEALDTLKNNDTFLKNNDTKITLEIPPYALHSYIGKLISIEHEVKLKVKTPFGSTSPKGKVNIRIVPPRQNAAVAGSSVQPSAPALDGQDPYWAGTPVQAYVTEAYPVPVGQEPDCVVSPLESDTTGARPLLDGKDAHSTSGPR